MTTRYDRHIPFFGKEGQSRLAAAHVTLVGVGGLGSHVAQQLALLGIGKLTLIDSEELAETNRNRYVSARNEDPIPGTLKVDIGERLIRAVNPDIKIVKIADTFVSESGFAAITGSEFVFGCLDSEGARLVLNEWCAVYERPYFDLATEIIPGSPPMYGGRVCTAWDGHGCIVCFGLLDTAEAQTDLSGPETQRDRNKLYGIDMQGVGKAGPSVVSLNGVVASLGVTEFMLAITGIRPPKPVLTYRGHMGGVSLIAESPASDCFYCRGVRGKRDLVDAGRYLRAGVGQYLR